MSAIPETSSANIVNFASKNTTHLTASRRAITDDENNILNNAAVGQNVVDNVKEIGVASSKEEAMAQFGNYIEKIPQDRKQSILSHIQTGQQTAKEKDIDTVSAIGLELATAEDTNAEEKVMGVDLYMTQMLNMNKKANDGK